MSVYDWTNHDVKSPTRLNFWKSLDDGMNSFNEWYEGWTYDVEDAGTYGMYALGSLLTGQFEQAKDYSVKI